MLADPGFYLGDGAPQKNGVTNWYAQKRSNFRRPSISKTHDDDARRTSALTNRRANTSKFNAKLPFYGVSYKCFNLVSFFGGQNTSYIRKLHIISRAEGAPPAPSP